VRGVIFAATAAAAVAFAGALGAFAWLAGAVRWQAFERPAARPGRVPAVEAPEEPIVTAMTASDVDSVPEALEARPRPALAPAAQEPEAAALGDLAPRSPKGKAAARKARKPAVFRRVGLGRARQALEVGGGLGFDGGGSGAFSAGAAEEEGGAYEEGSGAPAAPAGPAPARSRQFRAVTPARGSVAPAAPPPQEEGDGDGDGSEEE
jgi:hypothetical protein